MEAQRHLAIAQRWATLLDSQFAIGQFRFGLDPLINLIPWFGDVTGLALSLYLIWIGRQLGVPWWLQIRMWGNVLIDFVIGAIPIVGQVTDFWYRANMRNLALLEKWHSAQARTPRRVAPLVEAVV